MSDIPASNALETDASAHVAVEPGFKVFAGNLTYATDEAALKNFFASFADEILSTQIIFHGPRSAGYGFVTFKTEDAVAKAIETLDKQELDGRPVIVEKAKPLDAFGERKPRRKFGGRRGNKNVPGEASEVKTDGEGAPTAEGGVTDGEAVAKPRKKRSYRKKKGKKAAAAAANGTEIVNGTTEGDVDGAAVATAEGGERAERTRKPRRPRIPKRPRDEAPTGDPSKSVLFVANLAYSVDEEGLTAFFAANGVTIQSARVVRWRWGTPRKSKGYAFVDVGDEMEQTRAIEAVQGKSIDDREVTVKIAVNTRHVEGGEHSGEVGEVAAAAAAAPAAEPVVPIV